MLSMQRCEPRNEFSYEIRNYALQVDSDSEVLVNILTCYCTFDENIHTLIQHIRDLKIWIGIFVSITLSSLVNKQKLKIKKKTHTHILKK
jgi:hypothetical protein